MNLPPRKDALRQFWVAIRAGASVEDAVAGLGNNRKTGPRYSRKAGSLWFRQAGGEGSCLRHCTVQRSVPVIYRARGDPRRR